MKGTAIYRSPVGALRLEYEDGEVVSLRKAEEDAAESEENALTALVFRQLDEYFAARRARRFSARSGRRCVTFPTAKRAPTAILPGQSDSRKPPAQSAWRTTATPSISRLPVTASSVRTAVWSAMAAVWP